jgi:hypothetical protein
MLDFGEIFETYSKVLSLFFKEQLNSNNTYNLVNEYIMYFEAYSNSLIELDSNI